MNVLLEIYATRDGKLLYSGILKQVVPCTGDWVTVKTDRYLILRRNFNLDDNTVRLYVRSDD